MKLGKSADAKRLFVPPPDDKWLVVKEIDKFGYTINVIRGPEGIEVRQVASRSEGDVTPMIFSARSARSESERLIQIVLTNVDGFPRRYLPEGVIYLHSFSKQEALSVLIGIRLYLRTISEGIWDFDSVIIGENV